MWQGCSADDLKIMLNLLDGPETVEGQMFIFTTNRPNVFDDALIRPGRMRMVELGRLDVASVRKYLNLFFPGKVLSDAESSSLDIAVTKRPPTLGQLSQLLRTRDIGKVLSGLIG